MTQLVYCILAILILSVLTMTAQQGIAANLQTQTLTELETQLTGVGTEVLEHIGQTYYDEYTYTYRATREGPYFCGRVRQDQPQTLADPGAFTACTGGATTSETFRNCPYIEGFDGLATATDTLQRTRSGFDYAVSDISVQYVDPATFAPAATETFAKEVSVTVENPYLYVGADPTNTFKLEVSRVFTYGCVADYNKIPALRAGQSCPTTFPCARW